MPTAMVVDGGRSKMQCQLGDIPVGRSEHLETFADSASKHGRGQSAIGDCAAVGQGSCFQSSKSLAVWDVDRFECPSLP